MEDPLPENIDGTKRVVHSVEHSVNWGHVAVAIVALALLVKIGPALSRSSSDEPDESGL